MGLKAFLKENTMEKAPVEYAVSARFIDDGEPARWKLRVLDNEEVEAIIKRHTKKMPIQGTRETQEIFRNKEAQMEMTLASIVEPNLDDADLQMSWGAVGAEDTLKAMLTPGELANLHLAVSQTCDFEVGMGDKIKKVKNS